jgi:triacylglycerol lipase
MVDLLGNCHRMAVLAQAAYLDKTDGTKKFKSLGYTTARLIDIDGAQVFVLSNKNEMVLAFRGTEPTQMSDLAADLNAIPDRGKVGGFVHNGFQTEVDKVWKKLQLAVKKKPEDKPLFITGHSLGAAMATIVASRMSKQVTCLYTYGSTRVGSNKFVQKINCNHYRHVNNNDAVTTVPFALLGYRHHTKARYINHYGNIRPITKWQRFKDKLRGRWAAIKNFQFFDGFRDHSMVHYVRCTECKSDNNCGGDCQCGK